MIVYRVFLTLAIYNITVLSLSKYFRYIFKEVFVSVKNFSVHKRKPSLDSEVSFVLAKE